MRAKVRSVVVGLAAAGLGLAGAGQAAAACDHVILAELPVQIDGGAVASGLVNGQRVRMLIDTGADVSSVDPARIVTSRSAGASHIEVLDVGTLTARNVTVRPMGGRTSAGAPGAADVHIGLDILMPKYADLDIDLPHKMVRVIRADDCAGDQVVYWRGGYAVGALDTRYPGLVADVQVNGTPVTARLDSSASSVLGVQAARRIGVAGPGQIRAFAFSQEEIRHPSIPVGDLPAGEETPAPDMVLGLDFMLSHRIYVARGQGKVYVSYVGGRVFSPPPAAAGSR